MSAGRVNQARWTDTQDLIWVSRCATGGISVRAKSYVGWSAATSLTAATRSDGEGSCC